MSRLFAKLFSSVRSLAHPRRVEREMDEEIAFHIESRASDLEREGVARAEAQRRARVEFGAVAAHRYGMREALGLRWPTELWADLRYAARLLNKSRGFTAVTVLSLGLAIGANSAIFSAANALLFARLGVPHAQQLRSLWVVKGPHSIGTSSWNSNVNELPGGAREMNAVTYPVFLALSRETTALGPLFGYQHLSNVTMTGAGNARPVQVQMVSGQFYPQMQVRPVLGRPLQPSDDHVDQGAPLAAVLSYGEWQREFGGEKAVLGRIIHLNGSPATVVGVNPKGFTGARETQISPDVFVPLTGVSLLQPLVGKERPLRAQTLSWVIVMARARPGTSDTAAAAQMTVLLESATRATQTVKADETLPWVKVKDGSRGVDWTAVVYGKPLYTLLGLVGLVLLLACVNVANLMLARARTRGQELSLRLALGAGRARIFRQMLTESLLIAGLGGLLGGALAFAVRGVVPRLLWHGTDAARLQVPFDWKVFAFTAGVTLASALLSGLAPAWAATRRQPGEALKAAGRLQTGRRRFWTGKGLVALEVALSLVLVAGAALFLRTVLNLNRVHAGFNTHGLLLFQINLPQHKYPAGKNLIALEQLLQAIRAVPGAANAGMSTTPLLAGYESDTSFQLEHHIGAKGKQAEKQYSFNVNDVAPGYFHTMGIPIVAGRAITPEDAANPQRVAVINRALARKVFGNLNPIGRMFSTGGAPPWTMIVGICADTQYNKLTGPPPPIYFNSMPPDSDVGGITFMVRATQRPEALLPSLRRAVARVDSELPLTDVRTQEEQIAELTQQQRLMADLSVGFAMLALLLACVGVYGVLSYAVAGRTREIGIRLALGAQRGQVRGMVLREAASVTLVGILFGLAATLAAARLIRSLLYGIAPTDPVSLVGAALLMATVALVAAWIPAAHAARVDPMESLRHE